MEQQKSLARRPLLKALAGGVTALGAVAAGSRVLIDREDAEDRPEARITLSSDGGGGVDALDLQLGEKLLPRTGRQEWRSQRLPTSMHSMVAFTWSAADPAPRIEVQSRLQGSWTSWQRIPPLADLPSTDSAEWSRRVGTELVWIGDADGIAVRVAGSRPRDLTLVLLHPSRELRSIGRMRSRSGLRAREGQGAPKPEIRSRADWGADESWRDSEPVYNDTIRQVHVHHTVNSNTYARDDVPGLIRGMYRYHTQNLGWSDIGYNFLVDRFGDVWAGRAGGVDRPVRGAHTLGFNSTSTGISCIGNFETATPAAGMLAAVAAVAAWKLDMYDRDPTATARVQSEGGPRYRAGEVVELPVIDGHRDTGVTACPGRHLYAALPTIRRQAKDITGRHRRATPSVEVRVAGYREFARIDARVRPPAGSGGPVPTGDVVVKLRRRSKTRGLVSGAVGVQFGRVVPVRPGRHLVTVTYGGDRRFSPASATAVVTVGPQAHHG